MNRKLEKFDVAISDYTNEILYSGVNDEGICYNIKAFNNRAYCLAKL